MSKICALAEKKMAKLKQQVALLKQENRSLHSVNDRLKKNMSKPLQSSSKSNIQSSPRVLPRAGKSPRNTEGSVTSASIASTPQPYREVDADGTISHLRGWFWKDKEVQAQYNHFDLHERKLFRNLVSALSVDEHRAFHQKPTATEDTFIINPKHNEGLNYAYQGDAERRKAERKKLFGQSCVECDKYYALVREMGGTEEERAEEKQRHMNCISRHREAWTRAPTPPRYWDIGFPDDDAVKQINIAAQEQREAKRRWMSREADKGDEGRFIRVPRAGWGPP